MKTTDDGIITVFKPETANIAKPILVSPLVSVTLVRPAQPKKVEFPINIILIMMNIYIELPMNVTVEGIVADVKPVLANMARPSIVRPFTRVTEVTEDNLNALSPMKIIMIMNKRYFKNL